MDFEEGGCLRNLFRVFVCTALTVLLGLHVYNYLKETDTFEGDFSDIKYVVMQLSKGLTEVNRKHERLQTELERVTSKLPALSAAAYRSKDALEPSGLKQPSGMDVQEYDRQMIDYALESAGARVLDTGDTVEHVIYESPVGWALHMITAWACRECSGARTILQPGSLPGECWAFKGSRGEAVIRLLGTVYITGISMEHISNHISPTKEISSAPRLFQLEGLEYRLDIYPFDFGTFEYSKNGKPIQYFQVLHPSPKAYHMVRVKVLSNWGNPVYTCVYRVRIHGELASGQISAKAEDEMRIENEQ